MSLNINLNEIIHIKQDIKGRVITCKYDKYKFFKVFFHLVQKLKGCNKYVKTSSVYDDAEVLTCVRHKVEKPKSHPNTT